MFNVLSDYGGELLWDGNLVFSGGKWRGRVVNVCSDGAGLCQVGM